MKQTCLACISVIAAFSFKLVFSTSALFCCSICSKSSRVTDCEGRLQAKDKCHLKSKIRLRLPKVKRLLLMLESPVKCTKQLVMKMTHPSGQGQNLVWFVSEASRTGSHFRALAHSSKIISAADPQRTRCRLVGTPSPLQRSMSSSVGRHCGSQQSNGSAWASRWHAMCFSQLTKVEMGMGTFGRACHSCRAYQ